MLSKFSMKRHKNLKTFYNENFRQFF